MQELIYEIFGKRRSILKSVGVRVSLEEKEMRVFVRATRSHSHSHSFSVPRTDKSCNLLKEFFLMNNGHFARWQKFKMWLSGRA
jgi:hypothetical protein